MNRIAGVLALFLALSAGTAVPGAADDVHLANGQVFEGVIARRVGDQVRIRMAHGEMGVPASWVVAIEESDSVLAEYLRRKAVLDANGDAARWLELARWARSRGFAEGAREAALRAAATDPRLEGLAPLLEEAGFVYDDESGSWLTEADLMARRGYLRVGREWVPAAVVAERERVAEDARLAAERSAREARLDQAITLLALSQLQEVREDQARETASAYYPYGYPYGAPVAVFPGTFYPRPPYRYPHPGRPHDPGPAPDPRQPDHGHGGFGYDALAGRQPGSIIPLSVDPGSARTGRH